MAEYTLQFTVMKRVRAKDDDAFAQVQREAKTDLESVSASGNGAWETWKGQAKLVRAVRHRAPKIRTRSKTKK